MAFEPKPKNTDIAIIGMACRFPGANNYHEFWENLKNGVSSIKEIPPERWDIRKYYSSDINEANKSISKWYGLVDDFDKFDNDFFNISPREARYMDPQQRLLLEEAWHCIEDSGTALKELQEKKTDVYVGVADWDYLLNALSSDIDVYTMLGNHSSILSNRISHVFGLRGTSLSLDTACSSSLFAAEKAKGGLLSSEADYALAACACVHCHPLKYMAFSNARIISPDGRCKAFDKDANGFVLGDGIAVLLLQRLEDAVRGKKNIYGIIKGIATNHGGSASTLTSPGTTAQAEVIAAAYKQAGVGPGGIDYIEAHGTGTSLGDPIEVAALTNVFRRYTDKKQFCKIGSVKTNIGHTGGAAGMAGIIKVLMMMLNKQVPPSLNFNTPNPVINFDNSPFFVATELSEWKNADEKAVLRAGVSAFGFGGANAHMVLEEPPPMPAMENANSGGGLFILSAKSEQSLTALMDNWKTFAQTGRYKQYSLDDICATLASGRESFPFRFGCIADGHDELRSFLNAAPGSFSKRNRPALCLRIGECDWKGRQDIQPLLANNIPFKKEIERIEADLEKLDAAGTKKRGFRRKTWAGNHKLYRFITGYAFLKSFLETSGVVPDLVAGETGNSGFWTALAISGMIKREDALLFLSGKKNISHMEFTRPVIPFFDPVSRKNISPFYFDAEYIRGLSDNLDVSQDAAAFYLSKAESLLENQFTFKKYIEEWDAVLTKTGREIGQIIDDKKNFEKERLIFAVIIANCIRKLNRKWNFSEKRIIASPEFYEIIDLITDNIMPKETVVDLLRNENPDYEAAADILNRNQKNIDIKNSYEIIKNRKLNEIGDVAGWLKNTENTIICDPEEMLCFDFGRVNAFGSAKDSVSADMGDDPAVIIEKTMLKLWLRGVDADIKKLYPDGTFQKVPLPVYPFKGERHWLPEVGEQVSGVAGDIAKLHPLLHRNTSDLSEQRFSSTFTKDGFFLADHAAKGKKVLSGAAYLEMARAAALLAAGSPEDGRSTVLLKNVIWAAPITVEDDPVDVHIGLFPEKSGEIAYEIYTRAGEVDDEPVIHGQGAAVLNTLDEVPALDIASLKAECDQKQFTADECREAFAEVGPEYGGIERVYVGEGRVLARLSLPASDTGDGFVLHPGLMDAAMRASMGLMIARGKPEPLLLDRLEVLGGYAPVWAFVRHGQGRPSDEEIRTLDIDLCDEDGNICARMKGLSSRVRGKEAVRTRMGAMMLKRSWREKTADAKADPPDYEKYVIALCEPLKALHKDVEAAIKGAEIIGLKSGKRNIDRRFSGCALQLFEKIQAIAKAKPKGKTLFQVVVATKEDRGVFAGLSGLLKTAHQENPKIIGQLIEIDEDVRIKAILEENSRLPKDAHIKYKAGKRLVSSFTEIETLPEKSAVPWKDRGVYLITGGAGGLGLIFAKEIAARVKNPVLILTGRSEAGVRNKARLDELKSAGARVEFKQSDVTQKADVENLIKCIVRDFGYLSAIIHSAGIILDNFIIKKTKEAFETVLAPKVAGFTNLDEASKDLKLDFLVAFSSGAGALGNIGQADYACANAFMDAYAAYRNDLVKTGKRKGKTLSINWAPWKEGGMPIEEVTKSIMTQGSGMVAMQTETGIQALYQGLSSDRSQVMPVQGDLALMRRYMSGTQTRVHTHPVASEGPRVAPELLRAKTEHGLKRLFEEITGVRFADIDSDDPFERYGIDSLMITRLNEKFENIFIDVSKTLFYEYRTLRELTRYFISEYPLECMRWSGLADELGRSNPKTSHDLPESGDDLPVLTSFRGVKNEMRGNVGMSGVGAREPIAVIGVSGRYPRAGTLEEYWENLKAGKDCISEIPEERWPKDGFFHPDPNEAVALGKSYSKWGGFIEGFADFDPLFFNISPKEAMNMDPQERLFIEACREVIEDAGYTKDRLKNGCNGRVGVFAGITKTGYELYGPDLWRRGEKVHPFTSFSSLANRVSYLFDFKGPSMPVDTMCSSSLTAVHEACEHLYRKECEMAVAGGVNLYLHPSSYIRLCAMRMLTPDSKSKSFGKGGDGFLPGEGVGAVLLKPLSKAVEDRDHIYAVIRGTGINHGGRTSGYTVPSPVAQGELVRAVMEKAGVKAREITYIEAHGTGTELGDPIEIAGLAHAFKKDTDETMFCAIGSAKSNIGHLEAAAGIAGLTKIIMQMQNEKLVPSLYAEELNPNINFTKTPFVVQQALGDWKRPEIDGKEAPRIAGLSSFGAGGANAHILIEEYTDRRLKAAAENLRNEGEAPVIFVLSAKNEERLISYAVRMEKFLDSRLDVADVAYTTQTGREAMKERLAMIVSSVEELRDKLKSFVAGEDNIEEFYRGSVKRNKDTAAVFEADEDLQKAIDAWVAKGKYSKLLGLWVKGLVFDWNKLYAGDPKPKRISLPTYPFAKERYWIDGDKREGGGQKERNRKILHPLLHENTSDLTEQRFSSAFTGKDFFWADHGVQGGKVLPGVACLEMTRAAVARAAGVSGDEGTNVLLKNVFWGRPIALEGDPLDVHIGLFPDENGEIAYEIYSQSKEGNDEALVHCRGTAALNMSDEIPALDIRSLKAKCGQNPLNPHGGHGDFSNVGSGYGAERGGIESVYVGEGRALLKLAPSPSSSSNAADQLILHPGLMDSALQVSTGLMTGCGKPEPAMPFALQRLEIFRGCASWAYIKYGDRGLSGDKIQTFDMDLCDENGNVCTRMKGLEPRRYSDFSSKIPKTVIGPRQEEPAELMTFEEYLVEEELPVGSGACVNTLICFLAKPENQEIVSKAVKKLAPETDVVFISQEGAYKKESRNNYRVSKTDGKTYETAFASIIKDYGAIDAGLYMSALEDSEAALDYSGIVYIIQAMAAVKLNAVRFLLAARLAEGPERSYPESWIGFERSLGLVMPDMQLGVIYRETGTSAGTGMDEWTLCLFGELQADKIESSFHKGNKRQVLRIRETKIEAGQSLVKPHETYLITGGMGGLGSLFARYLVKKHPVNLILTGRSPMDDKKRLLLKTIGDENPGARVVYVQADSCDSDAMGKVPADQKKSFGRIAGVIHAAGIESAQNILEKDMESFNRTLRPKTVGTMVLDEVLKDEPPDFICYFSSSAAILGDFGSCDYAVANRFLTSFANYKNASRPHEKNIVINWPLWKEGGMGFNSDDSTQMYLKSSGQRLLETEEGLALFDRLLSRGKGQHLVLAGAPSRIKRFLGLSESGPSPSSVPAADRAVVTASPGKGRRKELKGFTAEECLEYDLKDHVGRLLKIPVDQLDPDINLAEFGFDSISLTEFGSLLSAHYGTEVSPAVFFEYNNIDKLVEYFIGHHGEIIASYYKASATEKVLPGKLSSKISATEKTLSGKLSSKDSATEKALPGKLSSKGSAAEKALPGKLSSKASSGKTSTDRFGAGDEKNIPDLILNGGDAKEWFKRYPECVPLNVKGDKKPCFWIHPLTGSVEPYIKIAQNLEIGLSFFGIRSRGFGTNRDFLDNIEEMAGYYIEIITAIDPEGPYRLAGFSMGGVIAYEIARQLQRKGLKVHNLFLLEPPFPSGSTIAEPDEIALSPEVILTTSNFFLYSHLKKAVHSDHKKFGDMAFGNSHIEKFKGDDLIGSLASGCREKGVKQSAELIGRTIRNMSYAFAYNKKALASYNVLPLPFPDQADIYYFTKTRSNTQKTDLPEKFGELLNGTEKLLGDELTHDETHYRKWKDVLRGLATVRVPSRSHFDLLSDKKGVEVLIEKCRSIYLKSSNRGEAFLNARGSEGNLLRSFRKTKRKKIRNVGADAAINVGADAAINVGADAGIFSRKKDIAIVGVSGRFPMAKDIEEFWNNLAKGKDCITEIPEDRWDWRAFYGDPLKEENKSNVKWGGFIDGIGNFDPIFFGISPREAEWMDPQQRLLMQYVWKAIEDAGYSATGISGTNTGLFIGTGSSGYGDRLFGGDSALEGFYATGIIPAMGPNRMSYFLDVHGPSEPVDTTCSSSLVALCKAAAAIENGVCDSAIAGGVNTIINPAFHIGLDRLGMLSKDGRCKTFSDKAGGYGRAEGVGMLFLKSLEHAEQAGDHIYGIIRAGAVNHGGRANSLTAPNPKAQVALLKEAYKKAGIDPCTIGYIETHGTGTELGDPIEIEALKTAFNALSQTNGAADVANAHCGLGSVKTNIGHAELAAGVAGVIKILLQLKHKTIVKSLHCDTVNPYIKLEESPFYIVKEVEGWKAPQDSRGNEAPRRAGVSSFGAGGANAHVIIEEYIDKEETGNRKSEQGAPVIFVLSAKNEERLKAYAVGMEKFLNSRLKARDSRFCIADVAYTSQVGREAMEERLALIISSVEELSDKLKSFVSGENDMEGFIRGNAKRDKETLAVFKADEDFEELFDKWIKRGNYSKLLSLWVKGLVFDWNKLYGEVKPRRVSLPTYPFAEERYWIDDVKGEGDRAKGKGGRILHPLLHENSSDLMEQRFSSVFTGDEFFLSDHVVNGKRMLPQAAYLEMARAAVARAAGVSDDEGTGIVLKNVVGIRPLSVAGDPVKTHIGIFPEASGELTYEIYSQLGKIDDEPAVHSRGSASLSSYGEAPVHDIASLKIKCDGKRFGSEEFYETLARAGTAYGAGLRGIKEIYVGKEMALARLTLPAFLSERADEFGLHPCLMDSALQASMVLMEGSGNVEPLSSFSLERLEVFGGCVSSMWALVRHGKEGLPEDAAGKVDMDLCDEQGTVYARIKGLQPCGYSEVRADYPKTVIPSRPEEPAVLMTFEEYLHEQKLFAGSGARVKTLLCFLTKPENRGIMAEAVKKRDPATEVVFISRGDNYKKESRNHYLVSRTDGKTHKKAFADIINDHGAVDSVLYMWAIEDEETAGVYTDILYIIQAMAAAGLTAVRFLLAALLPEGPARCYAESWIGFERSLAMVLPKMQFGVIYRKTENAVETHMVDWLDILWRELRVDRVESALYAEDKRYLYRNRETKPENIQSLIKPEKTYLITGGCGGLGSLVAMYLAKKHSVNLILSGRSPIDEKIRLLLKGIEEESRGSRVVYLQADICDPVAMRKGLTHAKKRFGKIAGVIHGAGIESASNILEKDVESFTRVLRPKIDGSMALDEAMKGEELDFICYFSSSSAILGDFGACDYAIANRFLTSYASYKNELRSKEKNIVINWPLWKEGGMGFDSDDSTKTYLKSSGQRFLETEEGLELFDRLLSRKKTQHLVLAGEPSRINRFLGLSKNKPSLLVEQPACEASFGSGRRKEMKGFTLTQCLEYDLKDHIGRLLKISSDQLDSTGNLTDFGFDSISFAKFAAALTQFYAAEITPSIFFGNPTIERLVQYFLKEHNGVMETFYKETEKGANHQGPAILVSEPELSSEPRRRKRPRFLSASAVETLPEAIAIIGMSGRFPGARNIDEMWETLVKGKDAVTEIPIERFDRRKHQAEAFDGLDGNPSNRCGILSGVSEFEPAFFEISPKEAKWMDPRQRLLLQESWKALEDAGYGPMHLGKNKMGLFVGMETGDYRLLSDNEKGITSDHEGIVAVRLAYFLNFGGPAMAINTACSSGLVAAHQACQSLRNKECDTAIAAGANLMLSPEAFMGLFRSGMLSPSGKCFAFDKQADGMVPGEAVASVVLKRLADAEKDNDRIYAVIKGNGINYDGKTNGITVPNGNAQAGLLKTVYDRYGIDPEKIDYIVTHGTGTKLGDSVEINALYDAFKGYTDKQRFCALTSTKTNFGHTFAASGLVSLISLVQALRHETIPQSLNCTQENDFIKWKESPFYVNTSAKPWKAEDGRKRVGAVSAFGMSGTNAHMVVESRAGNERETKSPGDHFYLLTLSAKKKTALEEKIEDMLSFFRNNEIKTNDLAQICLTLSEGRHHFTYRNALVIQDPDDAVHVLNQLKNNETSPKIFYGEVPRGFTGQSTIRGYAEDMLKQAGSVRDEKDKYRDIIYGLAELYCQGYEISLGRLYGAHKHFGLRLPTYPFAKERHWISEIREPQVESGNRGTGIGKQVPVSGEGAATPSSYQDKSNSPVLPGKATRIILAPLADDQIPLSDKKDQPRHPIVLSGTTSLPEPETRDESELQPRIQDEVSAGSLLKQLKTTLAKALYIDVGDIDQDRQFSEMGMDSIIGVEWIKAVNEQFGVSLAAIKIYDYPNLREFAGFFEKEVNNPGAELSRTLLNPDLSNDQTSSKEERDPIRRPIVLSGATSFPEPGIKDKSEYQPKTRNVVSAESQLKKLKTSLAEALYMNISDIDQERPFTEMGMDSIIGVEWIKAINEQFGVSLAAIKIYDYPNLREFAGFLDSELSKDGAKSPEPPLKPAPPASLKELLLQVRQGVLDIDRADRIFYELTNS